MIHMAVPFDAPSIEIEVRNPDLMDHRKTEMAVTFKTAMTGKLYGKTKTTRPEVLVFSFSNLPRVKAQELRDFVVAAAGLEVRLYDHESRSWRGKFPMNGFTFKTDSRGLGPVPEYASVTLEFEGRLL